MVDMCARIRTLGEFLSIYGPSRRRWAGMISGRRCASVRKLACGAAYSILRTLADRCGGMPRGNIVIEPRRGIHYITNPRRSLRQDVVIFRTLAGRIGGMPSRQPLYAPVRKHS